MTPSNSLTKVVLPDPLGPRRPKAAPGSTASDIPSTARTTWRRNVRRKCFASPSVSITAPGELISFDVTPSYVLSPIPSYRLHALKGDLKGYWSVRVKANWRIIFRFEEGDAFDVDLVDYH